MGDVNLTAVMRINMTTTLMMQYFLTPKVGRLSRREDQYFGIKYEKFGMTIIDAGGTGDTTCGFKASASTSPLGVEAGPTLCTSHKDGYGALEQADIPAIDAPSETTTVIELPDEEMTKMEAGVNAF